MGTNDLIVKEIYYRREKQWNIFSWSSAILVALIGGVITLSSSSDSNSIAFKLTWLHSLFLTLSILCLGYYSVKWVNQNCDFEETAIKILDKNLAIENLYCKSSIKWGYARTIIGLSAIAVLLSWAVLCIP